MAGEVKVHRIDINKGKAGLSAFVDVAYRLNKNDPHWVPPLRNEVFELLNPHKNPFFEHATVQPMIATREGKVVGRISAHLDHLALQQPVEQGMGPGTGNWGMLEAADRQVAVTLIAGAEDWLREHNMTRALGPLSLSIWDEPGLLTKGHDHDPQVMMGHHNANYEPWITQSGYSPAKRLFCFDINIAAPFPPLIQRIVKSGEKNERIKLRGVEKAHFDRDAAIIVEILNDAWRDNWGFVPITDAEIAYIGEKLKPLVREDLIMIAELDGTPMAFMMALPNINEPIKTMNGSLFPFGWAKLLLWLRNCKSKGMRVPLMGVRKELQNSRLATQLAFMLIDTIKTNAWNNYGSTLGEIGWILEDNKGMVAIADGIGSKINREYMVYEKTL